jgi:hypothetical protein
MRGMLGALLIVLVLPTVAQADGFQMKDGRYASGPVTVLALTADQVLTVKTKRVLILTEEQKGLLRRDTGVAPSVLYAYSLKTAGRDCTCFDFNISIWFEPMRVEVPHRFLLSDADAERKMDEIESIE